MRKTKVPVKRIVGTAVFLLFMIFFLLTALLEPESVKLKPDDTVFVTATLCTLICCIVKRRYFWILALASMAITIILGVFASVAPWIIAAIHCLVCILLGLLSLWTPKKISNAVYVKDTTININDMSGDEY